MALGSMSYDRATQCANELGTSAANIHEEFNKLRSEMNRLEDVLKSKGGDELYATYKTLEAKLDGFPNKVRDFQKFLNSAVAEYQADDDALSNEVM